MSSIPSVQFILYVSDQERSRKFYTALFGREATLHVPGMTEFDLGGCKLGLMPEAGIARTITPALPDPASASGVPRCEVYLLLDDLNAAVARANNAGARAISPVTDSDWGHRVAYFADPDGHVIALAQPIDP